MPIDVGMDAFHPLSRDTVASRSVGPTLGVGHFLFQTFWKHTAGVRISESNFSFSFLQKQSFQTFFSYSFIKENSDKQNTQNKKISSQRKLLLTTWWFFQTLVFTNYCAEHFCSPLLSPTRGRSYLWVGNGGHRRGGKQSTQFSPFSGVKFRFVKYGGSSLSGQQCAWHKHRGKLSGSILSWCSLVTEISPWTAPAQGSSSGQLRARW